MKSFVYAGAIGLILFLSAAALLAQPANDSFANAIPLVGPTVTATGSNVGATKGFGGPGGGEPIIAGNFGGANVWWTWTAIASGPTTIDTMGSDFDTLLGVHTGNAGNRLTLVADNNDYNGNQWSRVEFNAVAGTTYRIQVDGFRSGPGFGSPAMGNIVLHIQGVGGLTIVTPTNGMVFTVGDPIPVSVTIDADFPNPPATRVDFYQGGTLFASSTTAPFSAVASNTPAGTNNFYVIAFDSAGMPIQSSIVPVFVQSIGVTLLTPFDGTTFLTTDPLPVTAWTYLPVGVITNVEFFVDNVKFGEGTTPPISAVWSNVVGGSHRFTAVGRSDTGAAYNSRPVNVAVASTLVATGAVWKYLDNGSDQGTAWVASAFDDSAWKSGPAELGYGDGDEATLVEDNPTPGYGPTDTDRYITTYFRRTFVVDSLAGLTSLAAALERDDAGVVYLNGLEIFRSPNLPGAPTNIDYLTVASGMGLEDTIDNFTLSPTNLMVGTNVLAVEIHQQAPNSSDISFNFRLLGIPEIIYNLSPDVALTRPTNGFFVLVPAGIPLEATASDADGSVAKVEFYADGVKVGEATNAPYSAIWTNPPVGPHSLTAVAVDDQDARTESAAVHVDVYDPVGTPFVKITRPTDGTAVEGGTNQLITAYANAPTGVTNVEFVANGSVIGHATTAPFSLVWNAPFGTNSLTAIARDATGARGTSVVVRLIAFPNTIAPILVTQVPLAGSTITNLTNLVVTFSEPVHGVDAADLLVNGVPATGVTGSGATYTFTFPHPPYGAVAITWASSHGITDFGFPSDLPFDALGAGAQWGYQLIDRTPPSIVARNPVPGSVVTNVTEISVAFSEPVTGVDAADLLVNGTPALALTGSGATYSFTISHPPVGLVNVTWDTNHAIFDQADMPNEFNRAGPGAAWSFTLDNRVVLVESNSNWRFVKGLAEASMPPDAWRQPDFDDSSWSNAPAPFFFGDPYTNATIHGTLLSDMQSNYTTIFLRQEFIVDNLGGITSLRLDHQTDDGLIAWLNGTQVLRFNVPGGDLAYTATAVTAANEPSQAGAAYLAAVLTNNAVLRLVKGTNVLAVMAFNQNLTNSSDFGFNAQLYYYPVDPATVPPRLVQADPPAGDLFSLTNLTISFSEGVAGVDAADLLVNGVPATNIRSTTNSIYTFSFAQPPYGPVLITWDTNHGIVDFDNPPKPFDGAAPSSIVSYTLLNPSSPRIATQTPPASTTLTGLTSITVTFTEPVTGVEAVDLLVSGAPASAVRSADNTTYTFDFAQPPFGTVTIRWATNHGITDLEMPPAPFDPTRFGGQWNYNLIDPVPSVVFTSPTNNTFFLPPATLALRVNATDNDGSVVLVEFFEGLTKLGEGTNTPYALTVSNLGLGTYVFRAVATDNIGLRGTSAPVVINVVTSLPIVLVRGPYLQIGTPSSGVVRWRTDQISDGLVYYGTEVNHLTNTAAELSVTNEHIVQITGLEPDTKYYYSIGSAAFRLVGGDTDGTNYWFETSPPVGTRRPVRFWALGDSGTAGIGPPDRVNSVRDAFYNFAATDRPADLWLMLGDNAYNSGTDSEYQASVFDIFPKILRNKFLWPTLGNHETGQSTTATDFPYLSIFSLPKDGQAGGMASGTELYYSFDYANIHFVCLDAMTSGRTADTPMAHWLENDLMSTAQEWVIVFFHHSLYTKGTHDSDSEADLMELRQNILPILETHGVDMVLMGHSHVYERSYLLDGHYGLSSTLTPSMKIDPGSGREDTDGAYRKNPEGHGVVYTICGCSGQALGGPLNHPAHYISLNELGSLVIDVAGNRLEAKFLNSDGVIRDYYTITKPSPFPAAPVNLVALPSSSTAIALAWTPGSTNQLGYSVERSLDGINFTELMLTPFDVTNALDSGLLANVTYFYRVRATNAIGPSDYSPIASATTVEPTSPPRAPAALAARSDTGIDFYRSQMILTWQDRSTNEAAFQVERSADGSSFVPVATVAANINSYLDHNLASGTPYYYRVRSFNALGLSEASNLATDTTHPQSQLALAGSSVTFHGGLEGAAPVSYQWRFMDAPITGETNESLVLTDVQPGNEGDYTVLIRDATGRLISNPAYLFVVTPPHIVVQPQDRIGVIGTSVSLETVVDGTEPLTFQWRKNGSPLAAPGIPTLTIPNVQLSDQAGYDVVVVNDFGSVTSRLARLDVYAAPMLAPISDVLAEVLTPLTINPVATDTNVPPLKLTYFLAAGAPTNATVNPTNGRFNWTPTRGQAPSTNTITVWAADEAHPVVSSSMSFIVYVNDYVELTVGSLVLNAGETNSVPIDVFSSADLLDLQCILQFPGERLADLALEELTPDLATMSLQMLDANTAALRFTSTTGYTMQGTQHLAQLHFTPVPNQISAFVPLHISSLLGTRAGTGPTPKPLANDGRLIILGAQPLVDTLPPANGQRRIMLYGKRGVTYTILQSTNLGPAATWAPRGSLTLTTNLFRPVIVGNTPPPPVYYRARQ